jgi:hypothetical protein
MEELADGFEPTEGRLPDRLVLGLRLRFVLPKHLRFRVGVAIEDRRQGRREVIGPEIRALDVVGSIGVLIGS